MNEMKILLIICFGLQFCKSRLESAENIRRRHPRFLFTSPRVTYSGHNESVCLSLFEVALPTEILVDLKVKSRHYVTSQTINSEHECFEILVPKLRSHIKDAQLANLHVQIKLNGTVHTKHGQESMIILPKQNIVFIETDKKYYKPGDKVRIRILVLNQELKAPENYKIKMIKILNSNGIIVTVWENIPVELGFVQLEHQLTQDTTMGKWKIEVNEDSKVFEVAKYVLPRFSVKLEIPKTIYASTNSIKFIVCAQYSFGKNVNGIASIEIKFNNEEILPFINSRELNNGCASYKLFNKDLRLSDQANSLLHITATVTEQDTNQFEIRAEKIYISDEPFKLAFLSNAYFDPGLIYHGKLKALNVLTSLEDVEVEICYNIAVRKTWNIIELHQCSNFTFEHDGAIHFYIPSLKDDVIQIRLQAKHRKQPNRSDLRSNSSDTSKKEIITHFNVNRWYSPTNSYIQIEKINKMNSKCKSVQQFIVYYTSGKLKDNHNVTFHYMLKFRNRIYKMRSFVHLVKKNQHENIDEHIKNGVGGGNHFFLKKELNFDKFMLKFKLDSRIISNYKIIVYYVLSNGELVAADLDVSIEKCLHNKVEANWSNKQYYPGELANLVIKTSPNSLCAVTAIDKSVTLLSEIENLNVDSLLHPFLYKNIPKLAYKSKCLNQASSISEITTIQPNEEIRERSRRSSNPKIFSQYDTYEAFYNFGVVAISNLKMISKPCMEDEFNGALSTSELFDSEAQPLTNPNYYDTGSDDRKSAIRSYFPETWLWELVPVHTNETIIYREMPHTVTNWITNTLCVSQTLGVALSEKTEITAFQPFFLDVLTPYSMKRGETSYLQVILFNYLNYNLPIRVTLGDSDGFELPLHMDERSEVYCISAQESKSVTFRLEGTKLGKFNINVLAEIESSYPNECGPDTIISKRDMVVKEILVEAEGYPVTDVKSTLLCVHDSINGNNISWKLNLPHNIILDSEKAYFIINGDLLGPTVHNLERLLLVPTGCGEQIMAILMPNLYILEYFKAIGKLTPGLQHRARRNLKIGYQRILDYLHDDGSFSAFGYHDKSGSMFLTAFVVNALQQSKSYIYVDQNILNKAIKWILDQQLENGCFATISHVFHDMGGTSTENSTAALTSYVLISLLEAGIELDEKVKSNAKYCIRGHFSPDKYTLAISTYALFLVGWESEAIRSLHKLVQVATQEENLMWWSSSDATSINIEMTSYALMSLLHHNTSSNLIYANSAIRWLITQQGPNGGFISTQDTVTALSAISKYAKLMKMNTADIHVNVTTDDHEFDININVQDRLKAQQHNILKLPNNVNIEVDGVGCILAQVHLQYNLVEVASSEAFKLAIDVEPVSAINQCSVAIVSPCIAYLGPGLHSNMAILEVTMPSGYEPDRESLFKLVEESDSKVKKFEESENQVILYFTELTNEPICLPFNINENSKVDERIDAIVKLYDYYNPKLQVTTTYKVNVCQPNNVAPIPQLIIESENVSNLTNKCTFNIKYQNDTVNSIFNDEINCNMNKMTNNRSIDTELENIVNNTELNPYSANFNIEATSDGFEELVTVTSNP